MCVLRHLRVENAEKTLAAMVAGGYLGRGVVRGFGISSEEMSTLPGVWGKVTNAAWIAGFRTTAHAGDEGPPAYIKAALDELKVERIDHGQRLVEDPVLMKRVADEGIMLTLCPISDVKLQSVESIADMPIRKFLDEGVKFSLNSDDPAYFGGYILDNYCAVQEAFDLSIKEWELIARNAINGSWCGEERKDELRQALGICVERFEGAFVD